MTETVPDLEAMAEEGTEGLRFSTKKIVFEQICAKAAMVIPNRDIYPVLKNFQIEVDDNRVRVVATDLELSVVASTEIVTVERTGETIFPAKRMLDILREGSDDDMLIDVVGKRATIRVGSAEWILALKPGDDYPELPDVAAVQVHTIEREGFLNAIKSVQRAAAKDATRPNLMMIDVTKGKMTACDGVRFQQAYFSEDFPFSVQIPIGAVEDLVKLLGHTDVETIALGETEDHLVFRVGGDLFIASKMMAQFPDVESLLLQPALRNRHELRVDREEFLDAVKRVRINADPETSAIALELSKNSVNLLSLDVWGNRAHEPVDASWTAGDRVICVNHAFLTDMLSMYDGSSCHFFLGDDTKSRKSPVMLKDDDAGTVGIISQMRSDWIVDK